MLNGRWLPHPLVESSHVYAGSSASAPIVDRVRFSSFPSLDCGLRLCPSFVQDWESDFSPILELCNVAIVFIVSLGCRFTLVLGCFLVAKDADVFWGLLLSCFDHSRAKNNSGAWFDLNCVSPFVWGCHPVVFAFFTELWAICFDAVCSGWSSDYWQ